LETASGFLTMMKYSRIGPNQKSAHKWFVVPYGDILSRISRSLKHL
jgi:hypothetical protein